MMPIAKVQLPDGRIGRFNVPEGTTPEQVVEFAGSMPDQPPELSLPVGESSPEQVSTALQGKTMLERVKGNLEVMNAAQAAITAPGEAIKRGLLDVGEGIKQTAIEAGELGKVVEPGTADEYTRQVEAGRKAFEEAYGATPGAEELRLIASLAPYIYLPIKGAKTLPGQMTKTGTIGAVIGGTQFVPEGESRAEMAGTGGAVGAAVPPVVRGAGAVVSRVFNALQGKLRPEAAEIFNLGRQHNVPVYASDVEKGPIVSRLSIATESVPFVGMAEPRRIQNYAAEKAAKSVKGKFQQAGDWTKSVQKSLRNRASKVRENASKLYDRVTNLADPKGLVVPGGMNKKAASILESELAKPEVYQDKGLIKVLDKYSTDPHTNFSGLRQLRSDIGDDINDYYKGANSLVGKKGVGKLQEIKNSLEADMEKFATTGGDDLEKAWRKADGYYKARVIPFKDSAIAKASRTDTPDEIYKTFIKRGAKDRAQKFYTALDHKGRESVRYGMLEDAFNTATSEGRPFSPARFAGRLEQIQDATGVFFKGKDRQLVSGFSKLMRHVERSGQYMENPPTGNRVIPLLLAGGIAMKPGATAGIVVVSLALKTMFTSTAGKRLLFSASKAKPEQMAGIVNRLEDVLARTSSAAASRETARLPEAQE